MKRRTVVADASTLIGLSRIERLNLLKDLYGTVLIPAVRPFVDELTKQGFRLSKRVTEEALKQAGE